jgi:D-alanine-D-alanine ligase
MTPERSHSVAVIYNPVELGGQAVVRGVIDGATEAHDAIEALGHRASLLRLDEGVVPFVEALDALRPDVVFNLCEGYRESSAGESWVAGLLELLGIPYTGSGPMALGIALDKPLSKELFIARRIPTPRFAVYRQMPASLQPLTFPLMLKLAAEDASLGITPANVISDEASFLERLQQLLDEYHAPVLAEEFIDGREFTVALFDGQPLLVEEIEIHVEPRIVGFRAKWEAGSAEFEGTTPVFVPVITSEQREEIMMLAARVWDAIGMRDYARVDFRMDAHGGIHVLEANPNPDISAGSGYRRSLEVANIAYADFIARLLDNALRRGSAMANARARHEGVVALFLEHAQVKKGYDPVVARNSSSEGKDI